MKIRLINKPIRSAEELNNFVTLLRYFNANPCDVKIVDDNQIIVDVPDSTIVEEEVKSEDDIKEFANEVIPSCDCLGYNVTHQTSVKHYTEKNLDSTIIKKVTVNIDVCINHFVNLDTEFWPVFETKIKEITENENILKDDTVTYIVTFYFDRHKRSTANPEYIIKTPFIADEFLAWIKDGDELDESSHEDTFSSLFGPFNNLFDCFPKLFWLPNKK